MKPVDAMLFDLDRTLLDGSCQRDALRLTCRDVAAVAGVSEGRLVEANARVWQRLWPEVERPWNLGELEGADISAEAFRRALDACGCHDAELVSLARRRLVEHEHASFRLYDDAGPALEALAARMPLGLVTNGGSSTQRAKLRILGIEHRFQAIVVSGELRVAKPDAGIFHHALDRLGVAPQRALHVGDNLATDVAGARAAGLLAVWLNRRGALAPGGAARPDYEVRSLSQLV